MRKVICAIAIALMLAGCSTSTTEERVVAACADERVKARLPHLCADPIATARNIELAKRVLRVLVDLAL
jgi:PBP1b-binding outer membrane lipoprotein LpoB